MTDVLIPIKKLSQAKGRLGNVLNPEQRACLVLAMLRDMLATLRRNDIEDIWLVAQDEAVITLGTEFDARAIPETNPQGYNQAVAQGLRAIAPNRSVIVLPADVPLIATHDIDRLTHLNSNKRPCVGIVPDRHKSGTNGLFLSTADLIEPVFGSSSFMGHQIAATKSGINPNIIPSKNLALDIDTADDLFELIHVANSGVTKAYLNSIAANLPSVAQQKRGVA